MGTNLNLNIPKTIHLCWFSNDKYPEKIRLCIDSWQRILPDYRIRHWTIKDAMSIECQFVDEALSLHKWAFAADVIRLYALYEEGGIYLDSDILLKRRFDGIINAPTVLFQEYHDADIRRNPKDMIAPDGTNTMQGKSVSGIGIQAAFMISAPHQPLIKELLNVYKNRHFIMPNGNLQQEPIAPSLYAMALEKHGYRYKDKRQNVLGAEIYPSCFVAGHKSEDTQKAFAIHLVAHSWKKRNWIWRMFNKI